MRKRRKRPRVHDTLAAAVALIGAWREVFSEIPKTGQSLADLHKAGWSWWEVHRYFPVTALNLLIPVGLVILLAWHSVRETRCS